MLVEDNYYIQEERPEQGGEFSQLPHGAAEYLSSLVKSSSDCKTSAQM